VSSQLQSVAFRFVILKLTLRLSSVMLRPCQRPAGQWPECAERTHCVDWGSMFNGRQEMCLRRRLRECRSPEQSFCTSYSVGALYEVGMLDAVQHLEPFGMHREGSVLTRSCLNPTQDGHISPFSRSFKLLPLASWWVAKRELFVESRSCLWSSKEWRSRGAQARQGDSLLGLSSLTGSGSRLAGGVGLLGRRWVCARLPGPVWLVRLESSSAAFSRQ
jgi:hypothetical protein